MHRQRGGRDILKRGMVALQSEAADQANVWILFWKVHQWVIFEQLNCTKTQRKESRKSLKRKMEKKKDLHWENSSFFSIQGGNNKNKKEKTVTENGPFHPFQIHVHWIKLHRLKYKRCLEICSWWAKLLVQTPRV